MPTFLHPILLWGLPLVGLPLLIHLINMMRHRRVRWAAMEFLLVSQKKNRTWILLKQLLLLACRMTIVAAIVFVVAQPIMRSQIGGMFGGNKTHHIVLMDDSFSMSDRWGDTSAFLQAKDVVQRIGAEAARRLHPQSFTLLRFSRAGRPPLGTQPDFQKEPVDSGFAERLRIVLEPMEPSHLAVGPRTTIEAIMQFVGDDKDENRIVYLVSDFRRREWNEPGDLRDRLAQLNKHGAMLHLVNCVDTSRPNLVLADLTPKAGTCAAGVPLSIEVTVQNYGDDPVKNVNVLLQADDLARPAVQIAEIPPGKAVKEQITVHFPTAGEHQITARLESDAVDIDNYRYRVIGLPDKVPVLLIDGDPEAIDARYLTAALAPGGHVQTGLDVKVERPRYLSLNELAPFAVIYLANIERLDASAVAALEKYLRDGGGVGLFLGPLSSARFVNDNLYRDGQGFFPAPLTGEAELLVDRLQKAPDLEVSDHPIFRVLAGAKNSFISTVGVRRYFGVPDTWTPKESAGTQIIARLRNGVPLCLERGFGKGRVVVFLTTASPTWNNWARNNPSFVVAILEMQSYLAPGNRPAVSDVVGEPLKVDLDPSKYQSQIRFTTPERDAVATPTAAASTSAGRLQATIVETDASGIYQLRLMRNNGQEEIVRRALNVDPSEGDLKTASGTDIAARLEGVVYQYNPAALFRYDSQDVAGYNIGEPLLYFLIFLFLGEQVLAWSASYHPAARHGTRGGAT